MKIGDTVEVIKVLPCDFSNVRIGDKGIVVDLGSDLVYVALMKYRGMNDRDFPFLFADGSYQFGFDQVEVV